MYNASDFGFSISGQLPAASDEFDAHNATCTRCGMLALRDPWHHAERYQHNPTFRKDGKLYEFIPAEGRSREIRE